MSRRAACPCGAVRFTIDGPIRDVIICHCDACQRATGGPWPASAAYRRDLTVANNAALVWERAAVSEFGASRGRFGSVKPHSFIKSAGRLSSLNIVAKGNHR